MRPPLPVLAAIGVLLMTGLSGCGLLHTAKRTADSTVSLPRTRPALAAVILASDSDAARSDFDAFMLATARTGERVVVLSAGTGHAVDSFTAPAAMTMPGPAFPGALPAQASAFQRASFDSSMRHADNVVKNDRAVLRERENHALTTWARKSVSMTMSILSRTHAGYATGLSNSVTEAVANLAVLQQIQPSADTSKIVALVGVGAVPPPRLFVSLTGMTVLVTGISAGSQDASWQADMLAAGASHVFVLNQADHSELPVVARKVFATEPTVRFPLTNLNYGPAQYAIPAGALVQLRKLLRLLRVSYPDADVTINGYTDSLAVPGGNLELSWKRANAVLLWLVAHGVAPDRLQAIGHGAADPLAPNGPHGQPINRRVLVIISPTAVQ